MFIISDSHLTWRALDKFWTCYSMPMYSPLSTVVAAYSRMTTLRLLVINLCSSSWIQSNCLHCRLRTCTVRPGLSKFVCLSDAKMLLTMYVCVLTRKLCLPWAYLTLQMFGNSFREQKQDVNYTSIYICSRPAVFLMLHTEKWNNQAVYMYAAMLILEVLAL